MVELLLNILKVRASDDGLRIIVYKNSRQICDNWKLIADLKVTKEPKQ